MQLPLNFPSVLEELNLLCILSLLNFASGYRVPLHNAIGRGAFDTIRALVFTMYISSQAEGNYLSAQGMKTIQETKVANLMGVGHKLHQEKEHPAIPGVMIGELGGPIWELVQLVTHVLNETGGLLLKAGYPNLGAFVAESFTESDRHKGGASKGVDTRSDVIIEQVCSSHSQVTHMHSTNVPFSSYVPYLHFAMSPSSMDPVCVPPSISEYPHLIHDTSHLLLQESVAHRSRSRATIRLPQSSSLSHPGY